MRNSRPTLPVLPSPSSTNDEMATDRIVEYVDTAVVSAVLDGIVSRLDGLDSRLGCVMDTYDDVLSRLDGLDSRIDDYRELSTFDRDRAIRSTNLSLRTAGDFRLRIEALEAEAAAAAEAGGRECYSHIDERYGHGNERAMTTDQRVQQYVTTKCDHRERVACTCWSCGPADDPVWVCRCGMEFDKKARQLRKNNK